MALSDLMQYTGFDRALSNLIKHYTQQRDQGYQAMTDFDDPTISGAGKRALGMVQYLTSGLNAPFMALGDEVRQAGEYAGAPQPMTEGLAQFAEIGLPDVADIARMGTAGLAGAITFNKDKLVLDSFDDLTKKEWGKVNTQMKRQGYDLRGADDTKDIFSSMFKGGEITKRTPDHYNAIIKALGKDKDEATKLIELQHRKASRTFGVTRDIREGGYILPNGSMLDFSGKREGGMPGMRSYDHRDIWQVNEIGGTEGMLEFMKTGAIRMDGNSGSINISTKPTSKQLGVIKQIAQKHNGEIYLDIEKGAETVSKAYDSGTPVTRILSDIKKAYD
jgi:hypothetical protein